MTSPTPDPDAPTRVTISAEKLARLRRIEKAATCWVALAEANSKAQAAGWVSGDASPLDTAQPRAVTSEAARALRDAVRS